jgi:hypothetical protein
MLAPADNYTPSARLRVDRLPRLPAYAAMPSAAHSRWSEARPDDTPHVRHYIGRAGQLVDGLELAHLPATATPSDARQKRSEPKTREARGAAGAFTSALDDDMSDRTSSSVVSGDAPCGTASRASRQIGEDAITTRPRKR